MQLAVLIYASLIYTASALIYFILTSHLARRDAKKRTKRFPKYKRLYKLEYRYLAIKAIIFPYDIARKGAEYIRWTTSKF